MHRDLPPGMEIEESSGPKPIEGISTSTAGFVGLAERGPTAPCLVTGWQEFLDLYGGYLYDVSYLAYAVQGFFENGGQRCYVCRVVPQGAETTRGSYGSLDLRASAPGVWGNQILLKVEPASQADPASGRDWFRLSILYYRDLPTSFVDPTSTDPAELTNPNRREPDVLEVYDNLAYAPGEEHDAVQRINATSHLVSVAWNRAAPMRVPDQPFAVLGTNGSDGAGNASITAAEFTGDRDAPADRRSGLAALEDIAEISLLVVPDDVRRSPQDLSPVSEATIEQCERLRDRFAILSVIQGQSDIHALPARQDTAFAAIYYPWIWVHDPVANSRRLVPAAGHIAGIYARTDMEQGVHKATANQEVRGALDLEFQVTSEMQEVLNPQGVNCLRDFRPSGQSLLVWGARTTSSDPEWRYVSIRRLFIYLEQSIDRGTRWAVFEPNDEPLWSRVTSSIFDFLMDVWRSGALAGSTPDEAFFVRCDRSTMIQQDIDQGRLVCLIGVAPIKPAEFIIFRIGQWTADATQEEEIHDDCPDP